MSGARRMTGCMATHPPRFDGIGAVVASIAPQIDALMIYVNGDPGGFPEALPGNVEVLFAADHAGDLSANAKLFLTERVRDGLVFLLDDDFLYPSDYADRLAALIDAFGGCCVAAAHAGIFPPQPNWYYERTTSFASEYALGAHQLASLAGSGASAFSRDFLSGPLGDWRGEVMVDLAFSIAARDAGAPIVAPARGQKWLTHMGGAGLWERNRAGMTHHTTEARRHDWSFPRYAAILLKAAERMDPADPIGALAARGFDADLLAALRSGAEPQCWRRSWLTYEREAAFLELLAKRAKG